MATVLLNRQPIADSREAAMMPARESLLWTLFAVLVFAGLALHFGAIDCNDGYQYVSIAENISNHGTIATSLVHFDTERAHAVIPAPVTWFPPGYPAAIFVVSRVGVGREVAAEVVSILAVAFVALLLAKLCTVLGCGVNATRFVVFLWLASSYVGEYSRTLSSEALFTAVITAAILLLIISDRKLQEPGTVPITLIWAFALAALSAWVRYAGYFIFCGFLLYGFMLLLMKVHRKMVVFGSFAAGCSIIAALLLRNFVLSSSWQGSNTTPFLAPVLETASVGARAFIKLIFGDVARTAILLPAVGGCALILVVVMAVVSARKRLRFGRPLYIVLGILCVYCVLMFYAGLRTPISFGSRMFFPSLPLILALLTWLFAWAVKSVPAGRPRHVVVTSIAIFTICYVVTNTRSRLASPPTSPAAIVRQQLAQLDGQGRPLWEWINSHIGSQAALLAAEGQATGYVLHRPTVSLVEHRFSQVDWTEARVRQTMAVFHAQYLVVFPEANRDDAPSEYESPFLWLLIHQQYPDWLQIAESNLEVIVYQKIR